MTLINEEVAIKVLETIDAGLVAGLGYPFPGQMCVEAAVCFALGLPHKDDPGCVDETLRILKINLNDQHWSNVKVRAEGLRRLGVAQLGTKGTLDSLEFTKRVTLVFAHTIYIEALEAAGFHQLAQDILKTKDLTEIYTIAENIRNQTYDVSVSCNYVARCMTNRVISTISILCHNPHSLNNSAYAMTIISKTIDVFSDISFYPLFPDDVLKEFAENVVQILIDMKAEGTKWLYLTEKEL